MFQEPNFRPSRDAARQGYPPGGPSCRGRAGGTPGAVNMTYLFKFNLFSNTCHNRQISFTSTARKGYTHEFFQQRDFEINHSKHLKED